MDDLFGEIQQKAYFIGLHKDRNRISHTQEDDWQEAEWEVMFVKNLSMKYFEGIRRRANE
jgi:hypothetical protein